MNLNPNFGRFVRWYGSNVDIGMSKMMQNMSNAFRARYFSRLAEFKLNALLLVLIYPLNVPCVPEMCPYILAASHQWKNSCKECVNLIKKTGCLEDSFVNEFIEKASLKIIQFVHEDEELLDRFQSFRIMIGTFINKIQLVLRHTCY